MDPYRMPLARYYQMLRVAAVRKREEEDLAEERFAWLGWQIAGHEFQMKNKKPPGLREWREMVGLAAKDKARKKVHIPTEEERKAILEQTMRIVGADKLRQKSMAEQAGTGK